MRHTIPAFARRGWPLALVTAWFCLIHPVIVRADGMFVAPRGSFMYEPVQQAYLAYDTTTHTEQLSILPGFRGQADEFAWIVPTPSLPLVEREDPGLFQDLDNTTQPVYRDRDGQWGCFQDPYDYDVLEAPDSRVDIIESELVGYYNTLIIAATDAQDLADSLTAWGFLHDENQGEVAEALTYYVDRSWYFIAMKVDSTALAATSLKKAPIYSYYGWLDPIRLTFASVEPVYPLKISAVSAADQTNVHLYVNMKHRMTFTGADTWYANRFTNGERARLGADSVLATRLQDGDFLTKLYRTYAPGQMTADIVLKRADNDGEFRTIHYSGLPWALLVLLGSAGGWTAYRRAKKHAGGS